MINAQGLLTGVKHIPSPNFNDRARDESIYLLVIHCISLPPGNYYGGSVERFFTNALDHNEHEYFEHLKGVEVSSHLFIRRNGFVIQFVPFHKRAWHAGASQFEGREDCNDFSIGIELEGKDDYIYTEAQYNVLAQITKVLQNKYPAISDSNIVGHEHIAPGRKTDPGGLFDWDKFRSLVGSL